MKENVLNKISVVLPTNVDDCKIETELNNVLSNHDKIYSYLIYAKYKQNTHNCWIIQLNVSQVDNYNTLLKCDVIKEIREHISNNKDTTKYVVAYNQPSVELMLDLYKPLALKLAMEQSEKWPCIEYEDACSICNLTMIKLYKKGYYIHKRLLKRSFENAILMELRQERYRPDILSLEQVLFNNGDDEELRLVDMLPDTASELERERREEEEALYAMFNEVKRLLVDYMGERQFEQLLRDYGNKHTTSWSRKKMQQVKERFKKLGISRESFNKYL